VLAAAREALPHDLRAHLEPLEELLDSRTTPADRMIDVYRETGDIVRAIG
jgi:hypothetical protein